MALQGAYASHIAVLEKLGVAVREIRQSDQLAACDALVIPGGESTVITKLLHAGASLSPTAADFYAVLRDYARTHPVMGTCAGLILLARPCGDERVETLDLLPVTVERNAYGRQTESFIQKIKLDGAITGSDQGDFPAVFIRAPRILAVEPGVTILARSAKSQNAKDGDSGKTPGDPVMVQYGKLLGLSFHPELTPHDTRIHEYFLSLVR